MSALTIDFPSMHQSHWTESERANVDLVAEFVQRIMNDHDFDWVRERHGQNSTYVQHNVFIPDGIEGLVGVVGGLAKRSPDYAYDVKRVMADGDLVMFHTHATLKEKHRGDDREGMIIIDIWRVEDGQIAEHWDSIQPIPLGLTMMINASRLRGRQNENGNF